MFHIEWIEDAARLDSLEHAWDRLSDLRRSPFARHAWFCAWWNAFGAGQRLRLCTVRDAEGLAGVFPLHGVSGRLEALANEHTPAFGPLARNEEALRALIDAVLAAEHSLSVSRLPDGDPAIALLVEASAARRRATLMERGPTSPFVAIEGDVESYWARLGGNARRDFRRCRRLLDSVSGVKVAPLAAPRDLEHELARGFAVEGSGWKTKRGTAVLQSPATVGFYWDLAVRFARLDKLRLSTISVDDRVVAFNFNLLDHGRVYGLKGGFDPAFSRYGPGLLLTLAEIERCHELGLAALELLGDEAPWKRKFTRDARPHWSVASFARRPLPLARFGYRRYVRPRAKQAYHTLRPGGARG